jgi:hypothetical protein
MSESDDTSDARFCPDCGDARPLAEFYRVKAAKYAGGYRYGAYCKAHTKARTAAAQREAPEGSALRESMRRAKRDWIAAHPETNRRNVARHRAQRGGAALDEPGREGDT